jgi:hypothetical protein
MNNEIRSTPEPIVAAPIQRPTTTYFTNKRLVDLSESTPFPKNIFSFREYNSWKVFALMVFAFALFNFGRAFIVPIAYPDRFVGQAQVQYDNRGVIKRAWESSYGFLWQRTPSETKVTQIAEKQVAWDRWCASIGAVVAWLLLWLCFDWRNARTMIYGIFLIGFGVLYTIYPIDLIPDMFPFSVFLMMLLCFFLVVVLALCPSWRMRRCVSKTTTSAKS